MCVYGLDYVSELFLYLSFTLNPKPCLRGGVGGALESAFGGFESLGFCIPQNPLH